MRLSVSLVAVALLTASAGTGVVQIGGPLTFDASPAEVTEEGLSETGYEEQRQHTQTVSRDLSLFTRSLSVSVNNELTRYSRSPAVEDLGTRQAATFVTLASPEVRIGGQSFNPIAEMSNRELADRFDDDFHRLRVNESVENRTHTVLETETVVEKFDGAARVGGDWVDVSVHVTKVRHEGDYVVALAIYPQSASGEEERAFELLDSIEHDG